MKKSLWFWLCFVLSIILAIYFASRIIMTSMGHGSAAIVKTISISSDLGNLNLTGVAAAAGVAPGTRANSLDLDYINSRISAVPDIKTSAVRRLPNGNLVIKVKLHKAVAIWTDGETFYPLSADGTIIARQIEERPENSVVFRGKLPSDISEIAKVAHNVAQHLDYLEWIEDRRWNIHTAAGITIMLPQENPTASVNALMILDKNHKILSRNIQLLDMRDTSRILVK